MMLALLSSTHDPEVLATCLYIASVTLGLCGILLLRRRYHP